MLSAKSVIFILLFLLSTGGCARIGAAGAFFGLLNNAVITPDTPPAVAGDTWDLPDWSRRRYLTVGTTTLSENLVDFPVLVRLNAARMDYANAAAGGGDLRFTDADGNSLSHEIELWNASGESLIWVRMPLLSQSTVGTVVKMYYGNPGAASTSSGPNVFRAPFAAVFHLSETGGDGTTRTDSTGNATTSMVDVNGGTINASVAGIAGYGDSYDGANSFLDTDVVMDLSGGRYTQSVWILSGYGNDGSYRGIWGFQGGPMDEDRSPCVYIYDGDQVHAGFGGGPGNGWHDIHTGITPVLTAGIWQKITVVYDASATSTYIIYINGAEAWRNLPGEYAGEIPANTTSLTMGRVDAMFAGPLDEARMAVTARSAEWIRYDYLSVTDALIAYGTAENRPE